MVEAHQRDQWHHTAQVLCLVANCHRDPKQRSTPFEPWEFHPLEVKEREPLKSRISWRSFERLLGITPDQPVTRAKAKGKRRG